MDEDVEKRMKIRNKKEASLADELVKAQNIEGLRDMVTELIKDRETLLSLL